MVGSHFLLHVVAFYCCKVRIGCSQCEEFCDCSGFQVKVTCSDVGTLAESVTKGACV
jgi:hypothetical protein